MINNVTFQDQNRKRNTKELFFTSYRFTIMVILEKRLQKWKMMIIILVGESIILVV